MKFKFSLQLIFIFLFSLYFLVLCAYYNFQMQDYQQFAVLAKSFLAGKLYFIQEYSSWWHDAVAFGNQHYWPLGPFPAVLLMPFQIFAQPGGVFHQGNLQIFLVLGVFLTVFSIAKKLEYKKEDALYLASAFCFTSSFLGVAFWPNSWFFSQVITVFLMLLALREWFGKRRFGIIGILWGLLLLTRVTAAVGIIFFILGMGKTGRLGKLVKLGLPIAVALILLGWYNFARFGNPFEQGYSMQLAAGNFSGSLQYGLFSLSHVLGNLYYMLLATPQPVIEGEWSHVLVDPFIKADPWGLSIFFTSPYLLLLFLFSYKNKILQLLLGTSLLIAIPIIFYYGIGWYQFGYRYALDFFPFLFLLFMIGYKEKIGALSWRIKALVVLSSLINLYLFSHLFLI